MAGLAWVKGAAAAGLLWNAHAADEPGLALWDKSVNVRGAFGYKDNVLLSKANEQGSAFWQSGLDFMLLRLNTDPAAGHFSFFATAEDRRYFSSEDVEKEQLVLSQAKWEQPFLGEWKWGSLAQYMYADQVFDASATEQLFIALPVKSHNVQGAAFVSRTLPWNSSIELRGNLERQYFNEPLDDYWEGGPQLTWTKKYGHKSEWLVSYTYDHRAYDTRRQFGLNSEPIADTSLRFNQHEFESSLLHVWDEDRRWRSRVRFIFELNEDNGPGYYDYRRFRWSNRFGYYGEGWEATVEAKILHYDYVRQPVPDQPGIRSLWEYALGVRAERTVWKTLKLFVESEHEIVDSNYAFEEYEVNTVFGGFDWEF